MDKVVLTINGSRDEFPQGTTPQQILEKKNSDLKFSALGALLNGRGIDLFRPIEESGELKFLTWEDPQGKEMFWHSTAHLMAQAVQELFPGTKIAIGPPIEEGFYYDFERERSFTPEELAAIEQRMAEIAAGNHFYSRREISTKEAFELFKKRRENYKLEILEGIADPTVSLYSQDKFTDLCRGPHIPSTGKIKAIKLLASSGAYWRGSEKNRMLWRIYGVSYPEPKMLEAYLARVEEAKRRDHRKLGKELDLFSIKDEIGAGLVLWHPKGALVRYLVEEFWRQRHLAYGYDILFTPHIARLHLWQTSGHTEFYRENMYSPVEVEKDLYQLKPMNCPFHIEIYKTRLRSYRDLPLRWAELGTVYRYERSGVLHGLLRVRGFTQDDAHIFCRPDQVEAEVLKVLDLTFEFFSAFGFEEYEVMLSTRPADATGSLEDWERATGALRRALEKKGLLYSVDEGAGVFYGPKIDLKIKDVMGRAWQCTTVQFDFNLPTRFDLYFVAPDGTYQRPVMIHRALLGSMERFFGVLVEQYGGVFPLWLAPVQAALLPITDEQLPYIENLAGRLKSKSIRVWVDSGKEKIGYKIRGAESQKIPYMAVVGKKEVAAGTVALRRHGRGDLGVKTIEELEKLLLEEIETKKTGLAPKGREVGY
ncbi:MAG: threonine--tRNA ligase [candidate division Zixibacteria bacterium]|nr:threonine--tRNA ligase [candidate division Zixibacteria bacterium]